MPRKPMGSETSPEERPDQEAPAPEAPEVPEEGQEGQEAPQENQSAVAGRQAT